MSPSATDIQLSDLFSDPVHNDNLTSFETSTLTFSFGIGWEVSFMTFLVGSSRQVCQVEIIPSGSYPWEIKRRCFDLFSLLYEVPIRNLNQRTHLLILWCSCFYLDLRLNCNKRM